MGSSSRRAALTVGLGLSGLFGLVGRVFGQAPREPESRQPGGESPAAPNGSGAIGSLDIMAVIKSHTRTKALSDQFKAAVATRRSELQVLWNRANQESDRLARLDPASAEYKTCETTAKSLRDLFEAKRKASEDEFAKREAETLSRLTKEIHQTVAALARERGLTLVVRTPSTPANATDPKEVLAALESPVVYTDARYDLTAEVITRLNREG